MRSICSVSMVERDSSFRKISTCLMITSSRLTMHSKNMDPTFFNISFEVIQNAVERVGEMYPKILDSPFDFSENDEIELESR